MRKTDKEYGQAKQDRIVKHGSLLMKDLYEGITGRIQDKRERQKVAESTHRNPRRTKIINGIS